MNEEQRAFPGVVSDRHQEFTRRIDVLEGFNIPKEWALANKATRARMVFMLRFGFVADKIWSYESEKDLDRNGKK